MLLHPSAAKSADYVPNVVMTTSDCGICTPVPSAKARCEKQTKKNSGREVDETQIIPYYISYTDIIANTGAEDIRARRGGERVR